jgi:hypothetical protein
VATTRNAAQRWSEGHVQAILCLIDEALGDTPAPADLTAPTTPDGNGEQLAVSAA